MTYITDERIRIQNKVLLQLSDKKKKKKIPQENSKGIGMGSVFRKKKYLI